MSDQREEVLKLIKSHVNISDVFRRFGALGEVTYRGDELMICCPFHADELPSLGINDNRGVWHCFSCGRGGSAVNAFTSLYYKTNSVSISQEDAIKQILLEYPAVRMQLGGDYVGGVTAYKTGNEVLKELGAGFVARRLKVKEPSVTMNDVVITMRKAGMVDFYSIAQISSLMMSNMSPIDLLMFIEKQNSPVSESVATQLSVDELLNSVEW